MHLQRPIPLIDKGVHEFFKTVKCTELHAFSLAPSVNIHKRSLGGKRLKIQGHELCQYTDRLPTDDRCVRTRLGSF